MSVLAVILTTMFLVDRATPSVPAGSEVSQCPQLSAVVVGGFGPGLFEEWWKLCTDTACALTISVGLKSVPQFFGAGDPCGRAGVDSPDIARPLTGAERDQLSALVSALPSRESRYKFGVGMPDIDPEYVLEIEQAENACEYRLWPKLDADRGNSDVLSVLRLWVFLRQLFISGKAIDPQPIVDAFTKPEE